jgi:hypothetical protein
MMKFIGDGKRIVPGVPPRDLTTAEVEKFGEKLLLETGLYEKQKPKPKGKKGGE